MREAMVNDADMRRRLHNIYNLQYSNLKFYLFIRLTTSSLTITNERALQLMPQPANIVRSEF